MDNIIKYSTRPLGGFLDVEKIFSSEKYRRGTLPQPKTCRSDVIDMSHHSNNADVKIVPQFRKTEISVKHKTNLKDKITIRP